MKMINGINHENNLKYIQKSDKVNINIIHTIDLNFVDKDITLFRLKKQINQKLFLKEEEYSLFIDENDITNLSKKTLINELIDQYKDNKIIIKSDKNIFDIQKQINDYNNFLLEKINSKEKEIQLLKNQQESLINDLNE